jgi:hypothetical protein
MMAASAAHAGSACHAGPAFRVAFEYALSGDLAYLSHRDELRMLRRALVRADGRCAFRADTILYRGSQCLCRGGGASLPTVSWP